MFSVTKVSVKGQTTIPQDIRVAMQISPGDLVTWEVREDGTATVRLVTRLDIEGTIYFKYDL